MTELSDRLREAREYIGFTVKAAADALGWHVGVLLDLESGRVAPSSLELPRLAKLYRRPLRWFSGESSFQPSPEMLRQLENPRLTDGDREAVLDFAEWLQGAGPMSERLREDVVAALAKEADDEH